MIEPLVSIQLHGAAPGFVYGPGETLTCDYQIDAAPLGEVQAVEASILWHTQGKGSEDTDIHFFERRLPADCDDGDLRQLRRVAVVLPYSPLSYRGEIISILWCARVRAFLKRGKSVYYEHPFVLAPSRSESADRAQRVPAAAAK